MINIEYIPYFLEQTKDLIWMVDSDLLLTYANQAYLDVMKQVTGNEKKLNESVLVEGFGEGYIEKWRGYYQRALAGEHFEIEEHYAHPHTNEIYYGQVIFNPIRDEHNRVISVACQSRDITRIVKQRSEAHQLMDASLDVFCTINEAGNFVFVSEASAQHWGYQPNELIGKPYVSMIIEEDIPKTNEIAVAILSGEEVKSFVNRYKRKDGGIAYNLWSARWDKDARLIYCVARDAKEKIEQEKLLHQSEQRFRDLVQEGSDLIAILDTDGKYRYVSPTSISILGMHPDEFIGRSPFDYIHPEDAERTMAFLQKITEQPKVQVEPFRFKNHKGEWRWIETVLTNMLDNPAVNGIVANSRDVTEKNKEQHRLMLLESVITNTNDAVLITEAEPLDEPGPRIVYVNEAFTKMTGYTAAEVIGKTPRILQGPKTDRAELDRLSKALRNWESCEITTINYKKSGEEFWINFSVSPVADKNGWYTHWIAIERDVTEQKIKEQEKDLLAEISLNFNRELDYLMACEGLCASIGKFGNFDWVELWTVNIDHSRIQYLSHYLKTPEDKIFYDLSKDVQQFEKGKGLPGALWQTNKQLLWETQEVANDFIRRQAAKKVNFKTVLGIPLINQGEVIGALLVGSKKSTEVLDKYTGLFDRFHNFIGSEISRKQIENNLSHLYESIPDVVCVADFQGRFLKMNASGCALLGYAEEEILYHSFEEFVFPADKDISAQEVAKLSKGQSVFSFENRYLKKSGDICWLSWTCNANIQEGLIYATAKDITTEKKLRELNKVTSKMARIGSWELDLINNKLFWSEMVHVLHETDPNTFEPDLEKGINFYREDFRNMVAEEVMQCIQEGTPFDFEAVIVTINNKEIWVRAIGNAEFSDGKCLRIFGSFQDIHERKEAELRLQSLADNLPGVVFQYHLYPDGTDKLRYVTKGAQEVWGYSPEEVMNNIDLVWDQTKAGGQYEEVRQSIAESVRNKTTWASRYKSVTPNGEVKTLLGTGSPIFHTDGTIAYNSVVLDVTNEAKNEALLEQTAQLARIGSWELDLINQKTDNMYWSAMTREILEVDDFYNPSNNLGLELYVGESRTLIQHKMNSLIQTGEGFDEVALIQTPQGNEKWVRVIGQSIKAENKPIKIYGSFQDIHASKSLELQIREILESISDAFYAVDASWNFTYFNKEAENLLRKTEKEVIGQNIWEIFPAMKETELESKYRLIVKENKSQSFEYFFPGDNRWYEVNAYPSKGGVSVYFKNIDERKKANAALEKSEEKRRLIMNGALDAIITIDNKERITFWNPQAEVIFGWKSEQVLGKALSEIIIPDQLRKYHVNGLKKYLKTGEGKALNVLLELSAIRKSKEEFPIELTVIPIKQGEEEFFCAFIRDITERKKAEEKLLLAYQEKNNILESIGDAFFAVDENWVVTYWNQQAEKVLGKKKEDIVGKHFWTIYADAIDSDFYRQFHKALDTGERVTFEEYYPTLNMWFEVSAYPSPNSLSVYFKDVTLRKEADLRLQAANERFEKVTEATNDAIWDWNIAENTLYWGGGFKNLFGYDVEKVTPTLDSWTSHIHPDDVERISQSLEQAVWNSENDHWEDEYRFRKKDGTYAFVVDRGVVIKDANRKPIRMVGAMTDITEIKSANLELIRQAEFINTMTDNQSAAIVACDAEGDLILFNKTAKEWHGIDVMNVTQDRWAESYDLYEKCGTKLLDKSEIPLVKAFNGENVYDDEIIIKKKDDTPRIVSCNGSSFYNEHGQKLGAVVVMTDVTERKRNEQLLLDINKRLEAQTEELKRSNEELEQFAFVASHDLQEPLRMISSFMEQLQRKYKAQLDEKAMQYIHFAVDGSKRMKQIIMDLLDFSRANRAVVDKEFVDINGLIQSYKQLRRKVIQETQATITSDSLPVLCTHKVQVSQIFHCLLDNAMKYVPEGRAPEINIQLTDKGTEWLFAVKDNGIGIDPQFHEKIFIIFQRLHNRDKYSGTGVGLSIVKRSVEFLGGKIWLESTPGKGSTFYFTLPK